jgi:hypothetical protein
MYALPWKCIWLAASLGCTRDSGLLLWGSMFQNICLKWLGNCCKVAIGIWATGGLCAGMAAKANAMSEATGGRILGFAVTFFEPAKSLDTALDCPTGFNVGPDIEATLARYPEAERQNIRDNRLLLYRALMHRGPTGPNICLHPTAEPDPGFLIGQSPAQRGLNLMADGGMSGALACDHPRGTDPDMGEPVDNQYTRVDACTQAKQAKVAATTAVSEAPQSAPIVQGEMSVLIEVMGVRDSTNDPDVTVGIYSSDDPVAVDKAGRIETDASFHPVADKKYQTIVHGRIVDGVLITDFADLNLLADHAVSKLDGSRHTLQWRSARLRLKLDPDGSLAGLLGGYADWEKLYERRTRGGTASLNNAMGSVGELQGNTTCSGFYNALRRAADGFRDPKTGQCTHISTAYHVRAIPAFIIHEVPSASISAQNQR